MCTDDGNSFLWSCSLCATAERKFCGWLIVTVLYSCCTCSFQSHFAGIVKELINLGNFQGDK